MSNWLLLSILLAALAIAALAVAMVVVGPKRPTQALPSPLYCTRYPIVFVHGVFGFDSLGVGTAKVDYFRGIPTHLRALGADIHIANTHPIAGINRRAEQLARFVLSLEAPRVNIIAHSMGGLDARYAISRLGLDKKVVSLMTVGTPHTGTPVADISTKLWDKLGLNRLSGLVGLELAALSDLTTARLQSFNAEVPDIRGVDYTCYVATATLSQINPLLVPAYLYLQGSIGHNDGLVPAGAQPWGEVLGNIVADHWAQIGWSRGFDAPAFYAEAMKALRGRGG